MFTELKRFLVGKPIATEQQSRQRLNKVTALAVFSSDALSSVAYATEAILAVLLLAGAAAVNLALPIAGVIVGLLLVVGFSYRQTIHAYPNGGGAYIVARDNLGEWPSLVAAAALLIDYVLTVAVSVSAGVAAIVSLAGAWGWPALSDYAVPLALASVLVIALANLRGVRERGAVCSADVCVRGQYLVDDCGGCGAGGGGKYARRDPCRAAACWQRGVEPLVGAARFCRWLHGADRGGGHLKRGAGL